MAAVRSSNFQIDIECPQCGAPVVLEETENIIECPFCRVRSILSTQPFPCYYFEPRQEKFSDSSVIYIPYWRFKGLEFTLNSTQVSYRVIDSSWLAIKKDGKHGIPSSLGLRSQTQKLKFIRSDTKGLFYPLSINKKQILRRVNKEYSGDSRGKHKSQSGKQAYIHVGEIISLIYLPFYKTKHELFDGLTGKKVDTLPEKPIEQLKQFSDQGKQPQYNFSFMPGLCPNCGWELSGETDSLVLTCKGCFKAFLIRNKKLKQIEVQFASLQHNTDLFIPFWKLSINFLKISCSKYSDIMRLANLPKAILEEHKTKDFHFFIPAFKVNPKLFLRLGKQISLLQPDSISLDKLPVGKFYPANLPLQEGLEAVPPVLMDLCKRKKELWNMLILEKIKLGKYNLVYLSFKEVGSEYIQPEFKFSLPKNSLKFGRKL